MDLARSMGSFIACEHFAEKNTGAAIAELLLKMLGFWLLWQPSGFANPGQEWQPGKAE